MTGYRTFKDRKVCIVTFSILIFVFQSWLPCYAEQGQKFDKEPQVRLNARINFNVNWDIKEGGVQYKGYLKVQAKGKLKVNKGFSSMSQGLPAVSLWYEIENMNATYQYESVHNTSDPGCANPQYKYKGGGTGYAIKVPNPGNLNINYLGSFARSQGLLDITPAGPQKDVLIDRYLFAYKLKDIKVPGQKWKPASDPCEHENVEGTISPSITIHIKFTDDGKMKGSKKWTAKSINAPNLTVKVNNLPKSINKRPLSPKQDQSGNVNYSLDWEIKEPPAVQIFRVDPNDPDDAGDDITDQEQEIDIGEKVKLKAIVFPLPKNQSEVKGRWTIPGKVLKDWKGTQHKSTRTEIPKADYQKQEIVFFWFDGTEKGEKQKIIFKPDGRDVTGETTFKVKRPEIFLDASAAKTNYYGTMALGLLQPEDQCCYKYTPEDKANADWCEKAKRNLEKLKKLANDPDNHWQTQDKIKYRETLEDYKNNCEYNGIQYQYKGIIFDARPPANFNGEVQYVQLIKIVTDTKGKHRTKPWGIDGCYPYPMNHPPYGTWDAPGFGDPGPGKSRQRDLNFKMYLMYRPKPKYNDAHAWVPMKKVEWIWGGKISCDDNGQCGKDPEADKFTTNPKTEDQRKYPKWNRCSGN